MANNNVELSLKITADMNEAREGISQLNSTIKETASETTKGNQQSARSWQDVYAAQTSAMNAGHAAMKAEQERIKAQEQAKKGAAAYAKENEKLRQELESLLGSIDPVTRKLAQLDAQEEKLRESHKSGMLDSETFDDYLGKINNQREAISNVEKLSEGTKKLSNNSKTARRNMLSMLRGFASGNMSLFGNNLFEIANTSGKLPALFSAATLAIGVTVGSFYALGKTVTTILENQAKFNQALITTGNYAGTTAGQLEVMSVTLGKANGNYAAARQIFTSLAAGGKLTGDTLNSVASAASNLSVLTGKTAEEVTSQFSSITDSAANWAVSMNSQYHFLDIATYQHITALEKQGKTQEAIALSAEKFDEAAQIRIKQQQENLSGLERAWKGIKKITSDVGMQASRDISLILGIASIEEKIADLEQQRKLFGGKLHESKQKELDALYAERDAKQELARIEAKKQQENERAINAQTELTKMWDENKTAIEKEADAIEALRKKYADLWATTAGRKSLEELGVTSSDGVSFSGGQFEKDVSSLKQLEKAAKQYNDQLEKTLETKEESTQLSKTQYEIEKGSLQYASKLEKERAISLASSIDAQKKHQAEIKATELAARQAHTAAMSFVKSLETQANKANAITASSRQAQIDSMNLSGDALARANAANKAITQSENQKNNQALQKELNGLLSNSTAKADIDNWYNELASKLKANNNAEGLSLIDQLLPLREAEANLKEITQQIQQAKANQAAEEQRIQAQTITGLMTEIDAQSELLELHKQTSEVLEKQIPKLKEIATLPGTVGQAGKEALSSLELEVAKLNESSDILGNTLKNGLQNGLSKSLQGLADGTYSLGDAVTNLGQTIVKAMADIAAQELAKMAVSGMSAMFSAGGVVTAATGGYIRGAGTATSDSIPARLSNGEYVVNAAAVKRVGVDYLHAINRQKIRPFNTGGAAGSVPKTPSVQPNTTTKNSQSPVIQQTLVLDSGEVMESALKSLPGQRAIMTYIRSNASTIKQLLG